MGSFHTSGKPDYLEWYQCYSDPSKDGWSDGMEYADNSNWDSRQQAKWNFFYRPVPSLVGRPQKRKIQKLKRAINQTEEELLELKNSIFLFTILAVFLFFLSLIFISTILGFLVPIIYFIFMPKKFSRRKEILEVKLHNEPIIKSLEEEIEKLKSQIPDRTEYKEIESYLREELKAMELKCLSEVVNAEVDEDTVDRIIRHEPICEDVRGLLISGWGLLQPTKIKSSFGYEKTGYSRVVNDIGNNIATWRSARGKSPIYRVLYLQYIFLLDQNVNVYSFFYDFVTRKQYGKRNETFQYNHVSNFSIKEVELEETELPENLKLPKYLAQSLFNKEINSFTLAVSSGEHFRCVLIDDAVVEGMNEWLDLEKMYREAYDFQLDKLPEDSFLKSKWGDQLDDIDKASLLNEIVEERIQLQERTEHIARRALQQVREGIERSRVSV